MVSNREYIQNLMDFQNHYCISNAHFNCYDYWHFFASLYTKTILESNHPLPIYTLAYRTMNLDFSTQRHKQVACSAKPPGSKLFDFVVSSYFFFSSFLPFRRHFQATVSIFFPLSPLFPLPDISNPIKLCNVSIKMLDLSVVPRCFSQNIQMS